MKLVLILSHAEPETVFNAIRLGHFALKAGDTVEAFLTGKGVKLCCTLARERPYELGGLMRAAEPR
jgi:hypothetical protein